MRRGQNMICLVYDYRFLNMIAILSRIILQQIEEIKQEAMTQLIQLPKTGNAKLIRHHMLNPNTEPIDIPDGDIEHGKMLYNGLCAGCHNYIGYGPNLHHIYGARGGVQKEFLKYGSKNKGLKYQRWSKHKLFTMLQDPQAVFGIESGMLFDGIKDPYDRASIVEYIHFMRFTNPYGPKVKDYMKY